MVRKCLQATEAKTTKSATPIRPSPLLLQYFKAIPFLDVLHHSNLSRLNLSIQNVAKGQKYGEVTDAGGRECRSHSACVFLPPCLFGVRTVSLKPLLRLRPPLRSLPSCSCCFPTPFCARLALISFRLGRYRQITFRKAALLTLQWQAGGYIFLIWITDF